MHLPPLNFVRRRKHQLQTDIFRNLLIEPRSELQLMVERRDEAFSALLADRLCSSERGTRKWRIVHGPEAREQREQRERLVDEFDLPRLYFGDDT